VRRRGGEDLIRVREGAPLPGDERGPWRPAVLMFGDFGVNTNRIDEQSRRFQAWSKSVPQDAKLAIVEIGAGRAVPTIRNVAERTARSFSNASLVRINLEDAAVPPGCGARRVSIDDLGALAALTAIDELLGTAPA